MLVNKPENPSSIIVNHSGGKDSTIMLALVVEAFQGKVPIIAHHQNLPEAWEGTEEYCRATCEMFNIPLVVEQARYTGYECPECGNRWLSALPKLRCPVTHKSDGTIKGCGKETGQEVTVIRGLVDLMNWRQMWPSSAQRWCTSYLKRDLFNKWARRNRDTLGDNPVSCMGERWAESAGRSKLPYFMPRPSLPWLTDWKPILHLKRIEVFQGLRARGIEPHWCYKAQGMTDQDMYEVDTEGGPRCSCVCCIYLTPENVAANLNLPVNQDLKNQLLETEARTGHYFREGRPLASML